MTLEDWIILIMLTMPLRYSVIKNSDGMAQLQAQNDEGLQIIWEYTSPQITTYMETDHLGQLYIGQGLNPLEAMDNKEIVKRMMQF